MTSGHLGNYTTLTDATLVGAPFVAIAAQPWPGPVAVWRSVEDAGYELAGLVSEPAVVGETQTELREGRPGVIDNGPLLRVRLVSGMLSGISTISLLNGGNLAAIGSGRPDEWEIIQFSTARLVGPNTYDIGTRLRGQFGTKPSPSKNWPAGSYFVLFNDAVRQVPIPRSLLGIEHHYRVGLASLGLADPDVVHSVQAFRGVSLRPYAVAHLRGAFDGAGNAHLTWVRRTRLGGDSWDGIEVPLGEEGESYLLSISTLDGFLKREVLLTEPNFNYSSTLQALDDVGEGFRATVQQLSQVFGPGPGQMLTLRSGA